MRRPLLTFQVVRAPPVTENMSVVCSIPLLLLRPPSAATANSNAAGSSFEVANGNAKDDVIYSPTIREGGDDFENTRNHLKGKGDGDRDKHATLTP